MIPWLMLLFCTPGLRISNGWIELEFTARIGPAADECECGVGLVSVDGIEEARGRDGEICREHGLCKQEQTDRGGASSEQTLSAEEWRISRRVRCRDQTFHIASIHTDGSNRVRSLFRREPGSLVPFGLWNSWRVQASNPHD